MFDPHDERAPCGGCGRPSASNSPGGLCPACLLGTGARMVASTWSDTGKFETPSIDELALLFPEFQITALLGRGGMGAVYRATQISPEREVAVKILPAELGGGDGEFIERFRREAAVLARLENPNIVTLYDFGERGGFAYLVMEFVDGTDLAKRLRRRNVQREEAIDMAGKLCDALHYSHSQGIVHRDIKPANVLLGEDGSLKVADFGLAKLTAPEDAGMELTRTNVAVGTPRYMAPEQLAGAKDADHRVDIYALGVVIFELLTGKYPAGKLGPPSERNPEVDPLFDDVVLRALSKEPTDRYGDAAEVKSHLRDASEGRGLTRQQRERRHTWKKRVALAVAATLAAGISYALLR